MSFEVIDFLCLKDLLDPSDNISVETLSGGYWNENFRVTGGGIDWVVKRNRKGLPGESLFPNLPESEALALECLCDSEVAPTPVQFFSDDRPVLVYEYLPGNPWSSEVEPVAQLLRRLHGIPSDRFTGFRSLPVRPAEILQQGDEILPVGSDPWSDHLRNLRPEAFSLPTLDSITLIHTDVGAGNIIVGPAGARLIDWQCPGLGDPAEDIWAFLAPSFQILFDHAPLTDQEREDFLTEYGDQRTIERMVSFSPCFDYRMAAYCCLRGQELERIDPQLSRKYRKAGEAQTALLSGQ